jgi:hypothetical protein
MSEQAALPTASPGHPRRAPFVRGVGGVGRRAADERGACGGVAVDELAERSEVFR